MHNLLKNREYGVLVVYYWVNTSMQSIMGKKAYLFCQNDLSCLHAAEMYSFFGSCKVLGKNPEHWLTYALKQIKTCPKDRLEELLPENWTDDIVKKSFFDYNHYP